MKEELNILDCSCLWQLKHKKQKFFFEAYHDCDTGKLFIFQIFRTNVIIFTEHV